MLLSIQNLAVNYGAIRALHDVSLEIARGEIVTLIGSNGAGKTTLLRTISGLVKAAAGRIVLVDSPDGGATAAPSSPPPPPRGAKPQVLPYATPAPPLLNGLRPDQIVRRGISHVPEGRQVFANLTVRENLMLGAYQEKSEAVWRPEMERCYALFPVLAERREQRAGTLSGGEQQMLAIGRALMARPELLLLDEPSLGLAPLIVRRIFEIIREINREGTTIFLVEQNAHMALTVAHRGYVLQTGRIILADQAANLLENPEVKRAYLGG